MERSADRHILIAQQFTSLVARVHTSEFPSTCSSHFSTTFSAAWPRTLLYQWLDHPPGQTHPALPHPASTVPHSQTVGHRIHSEARSTAYFSFLLASKCWKVGTLWDREISPHSIMTDCLISTSFKDSHSSEQAFADSPGAHNFQEVGLATDTGWRAKTIVFPLFHYQLAGRMHNPNRNCSFHRKSWGPQRDSPVLLPPGHLQGFQMLPGLDSGL